MPRALLLGSRPTPCGRPEPPQAQAAGPLVELAAGKGRPRRRDRLPQAMVSLSAPAQLKSLTDVHMPRAFKAGEIWSASSLAVQSSTDACQSSGTLIYLRGACGGRCGTLKEPSRMAARYRCETEQGSIVEARPLVGFFLGTRRRGPSSPVEQEQR